MVRFDIITLFPRMFDSPLQESIVYKARQAGLISIALHDLRDYTCDRHRTADDTPYGGGAGMVLKVEPLVAAIEAIRSATGDVRTVLTSPQGEKFTQAAAVRLSRLDQIVFVCGRYEGVDERVLDYVDEEISLGDYVLTGGELAAMVIVDAVARQIPGVVGAEENVVGDSLANGLLKYPQYTRPPEFRGAKVPDILMSGDHKKIEQWRRAASLKRTAVRRPDLLRSADVSEEDRNVLLHYDGVVKSQKQTTK
jgi:tRNA (guanine37-N1)-methyltransferase